MAGVVRRAFSGTGCACASLRYCAIAGITASIMAIRKEIVLINSGFFKFIFFSFCYVMSSCLYLSSSPFFRSRKGRANHDTSPGHEIRRTACPVYHGRNGASRKRKTISMEAWKIGPETPPSYRYVYIVSMNFVFCCSCFPLNRTCLFAPGRSLQ